MTWLDTAKTIPLPDVLAALGIGLRPRGTYGPCPECGAERRGANDNRGPLGLGTRRVGWRCHRCQKSGDGITAAALLTGDARAFFADRGWCEPAPGHVVRPIVPPKPAPPPPPRPPVPLAEVRELVSGCLPADPTWTDPRMASAATHPGLVGRLPEHGSLPLWAVYRGRTWRESGHVAIVPLWTVNGVLAGVRARAPGPRLEDSPKALPPRGFAIPKALMANPTARAWLRGGPLPPSIVIVEGEPAWVLWSVACPDVAVLGFYSGAWDDAWIEKINAADRPVLVVTDHDPAGDEYARKLTKIRRGFRWPEEKDAVTAYVG